MTEQIRSEMIRGLKLNMWGIGGDWVSIDNSIVRYDEAPGLGEQQGLPAAPERTHTHESQELQQNQEQQSLLLPQTN